MAGHIKQATVGNFRTLLQEEKPVVVDFWANWCAPCHTMNPILRRLAEKFDGQIIFAKVDVDSDRDLAEQFDISSIPTLILFKRGKEWDRLTGIRGRSELNKLFQKLAS